MKKWKQQIQLPDGEIYDVVEHTDEECRKKRSDGQHLAAISHGFVCLYQDGNYKKWCGVTWAKERIVKAEKTVLPKKPSNNEVVKLNTPEIRRAIQNILWDILNTESPPPFSKIKINDKNGLLSLDGKAFLCYVRHHHYPNKKDHLYAVFEYLESVKEAIIYCKDGIGI